MGKPSSTMRDMPEPTIGGTAWARFGRVMPWAAWSLILAPVSIVLHELAHMLIARAVGFSSPTLHFGSVDPGPSDGVTLAASGWVALAGPAASVALALAGCVGLRSSASAPWAAALAVSAASRFAVGVPYTVVNLVVRSLGRRLTPPAFDEYKAGMALGWSGDVLLAGTSLVLVLVLWWVGCQLRRGKRMVAWSGLLIGTTTGWAVWMLALGPRLLP